VETIITFAIVTYTPHFASPLHVTAYFTSSLPASLSTMDHPPELAALLEKYPSLRKAVGTGIEVYILSP
jgi:hypothetical protein